MAGSCQSYLVWLEQGRRWAEGHGGFLGLGVMLVPHHGEIQGRDG